MSLLSMVLSKYTEGWKCLMYQWKFESNSYSYKPENKFAYTSCKFYVQVKINCALANFSQKSIDKLFAQLHAYLHWLNWASKNSGSTVKYFPTDSTNEDSSTTITATIHHLKYIYTSVIILQQQTTQLFGLYCTKEKKRNFLQSIRSLTDHWHPSSLFLSV